MLGQKEAQVTGRTGTPFDQAMRQLERERNRERVAAQKREYYERNRERVAAQKREYRERNRTCSVCGEPMQRPSETGLCGFCEQGIGAA